MTDYSRPDSGESKTRKFTEQFEVAGEELVTKVKELMADSSARKVVIKNDTGKELLTVPLNVGVAAGGLAVLAAPVLAAVGALAALATHVRLEVVRDDEPGGDVPPSTPTPPPAPPTGTPPVDGPTA